MNSRNCSIVARGASTAAASPAWALRTRRIERVGVNRATAMRTGTQAAQARQAGRYAKRWLRRNPSRDSAS